MLHGDERLIKTFWPSIGAFALGKWIGKMWEKALRRGWVVRLAAGLVLAPLAMITYLWRIRPSGMRRYMITDRRVVILRGLIPKQETGISWEEVDRIEAQPQPGQDVFRAADVVFFREDRPVLILPGVSLAENFVRICRRTRQAYLEVQAVRRRAA